MAIPLPFNIGGSVFSTPENISWNLLSKAHFFPLTGIFVFAPAAQDRANHRRIYFGDQLIYPPPVGAIPERAYWHDQNRLGYGNVGFVDTHVKYLQATYNKSGFERGSTCFFCLQ